jgi:hypothetical protein
MEGSDYVELAKQFMTMLPLAAASMWPPPRARHCIKA